MTKRWKSALVMFAVLQAAFMASAQADPIYKLQAKGHSAVYGHPLDQTHFETCGHMVIDIPKNAKLHTYSGSCPSDDPFLPFAGHQKLKTPKPRTTPS